MPHGRMSRRPAVADHVPEPRLPGVAGIGPKSFRPVRVSRIPRLDEIGTIDKILVEEPRQPTGQLEAFPTIAVGKIPRHRSEAGLAGGCGEQLEDSPDKELRIEGWSRIDRQVQRTEKLVGKRTRKREADMGGDSKTGGQFQLQPPGHSLALDHDRLRNER